VTILLGIFRGHGGTLLLADVEPLKYKYRIGLETLVVYTVNSWVFYFYIEVNTKYLAWGVKLQSLNLNKLAGTFLTVECVD